MMFSPWLLKSAVEARLIVLPMTLVALQKPQCSKHQLNLQSRAQCLGPPVA